MRKRPNIHWINEIRTVPEKCDNCSLIFSPWDDILVELWDFICYCMNCAEDDEVWPNIWEWVHHIYSYIASNNEFYNVSDTDKFENFIWQKLIYDTPPN